MPADRLLLLAIGLFIFGMALAGCAGEGSTAKPDGPSSEGWKITSPAFSGGHPIPARFSCDGQNVSPKLEWTSPPPDAKSLAIIVDDPDAPSGTFTHWVVFDIPVEMRDLPENVQPGQLKGARQGHNGFGRIGYGGPCPPPGKPHHYHFKLFALDKPLGLASGVGVDQVKQAISHHVVGSTEIVGTYQRH